MSSKRSLPGATVAGLFVLALAGCGGGSDGADPATAQGSSVENAGPQSGAGSADAFISRVMALVADTSETAEPIEIESISVTAPESAQPASIS